MSIEFSRTSDRSFTSPWTRSLVFFVMAIVTTASAQTGLVLSESELDFSASERGDFPAPQSFAATASSPTALSIRIEGGEWIRVRPAFATTPTRVQVSIDPGRLLPGNYSARIVVSSAENPDQ